MQRLRERYPRWGKDELVVLECEQGYQVSTSMAGSMLQRLKDGGVLLELLEQRKENQGKEVKCH